MIRNTETLTRFLRSKESVGDIVAVAHKLLSREFDFELPNHEGFLLELICDRLNDNSSFKHWKFETQVWQLLSRIWPQVANRDRKFRKVKLFDVLIKIFTSFYDVKPNQAEFFTQLLASVNQIYNDFTLNADEQTCTNLLIAFVNIYETDLEDEVLIQWTQLAEKLFKVAMNDVNYNPTKKSVDRLFTKLFPKLLLSIQNFDLRLEPSSRIFVQLIKENILWDEHLQDNFTEFLKTSPTPASVAQLYNIIIDNIGNKDITTCEDIFMKIIQLPKYSSMSETLIGILANTNKPLTTEFFDKVFTATMATAPINWKLVAHIVALDVTLAVNKSDVIIKALNEDMNQQVLTQLIEAYVRARELPAFCTTVWPSHIEAWASEEIIDTVARNINELSSVQLNKVIQFIYQGEENLFPIILAISRGLYRCPGVKLESIEELLFSNQKYIENDSYWELKFRLLINYPHKSSLVPTKTKEYTEFYFLCMFRLAELGHDTISSSLLKKFTKFVPHQDYQFLQLLLRRWCIIINEFFDEKSLDSLVAEFKKIPHEFWPQLFQSHFVIFEQKKLIRPIINTIDPKFLPLIPIQCFERADKVRLINELTSQKLVVKHLLPTFKSDIETDIKKLTSLLDDEEYIEIFTLVWKHNLKQAKSDNKFSINALNEFIQLKPQKRLTKEVVAMGLILQHTTKESLPDPSLLVNLREKYVPILLGLKKDYQDVAFCKKYLYLVDNILEDTEIPVEIIRKAGKHNHPELQVILFRLLTRVSGIESYKHILALSMLLHQKNISSCLIRYFTKINDPEVALYVLTSFTLDVSLENSEGFITIINCLTKSFTKSDNFLGYVISIVLNRFLQLSPQAVNLFILNTKDLLTNASWAFTQYSIEMVLSLIGYTAKSLTPGDEDTYTLLTQTVAHVLLFHRFRLSSRHHLVNAVFIRLLEPLTLKKSPLPKSPLCAGAYARLLGNLCEPQATNVVNDQLTTASNLIKKHLRNYLPVLLVNYISLSLTSNFSRENSDEILRGISNIFDVLSKRELQISTSMLDSQGMIVYRSLYSDYKTHGKWRDN